MALVVNAWTVTEGKSRQAQIRNGIRTLAEASGLSISQNDYDHSHEAGETLGERFSVMYGRGSAFLDGKWFHGVEFFDSS